MLMLFTQGNAAHDGAPFNSWFIGDLASWAKRARIAMQQGEFGFRQSLSMEMKWGTHLAGEQRPEWAACSERMTMSVLVRGRFLLRFRSPNNREQMSEHCLKGEGDYAVWGTDSEHTWVAEEDSVIFTVRWKEMQPTLGRGPLPP